MSRALFAALGAATLIAGTASAADLPTHRAPVAPYTAAPAFTWTGFYAGVNAGVALRDSKVTAVGTAGFTGNVPLTTGNTTRFAGGGQIGYNYQISSLVLGVEADLDYLAGKGFDASGAIPAGIAAGTFTVTGSRKPNYLGTVRGRVGYAFDRTLFYVTGGLAYGAVAGGGAGSATLGGNKYPFTSTSSDSAKLGYALGAGVEYAFTANWTGRVQYLYADLGRSKTTYATTVRGTAYSSVVNPRNQVSLITLGLNYKF
jgi:outer membrane immunogenic protein